MMDQSRTSCRVLVTGGCGFIGSWLVESLLAMGYEVVVVDDLSTGCIENLDPARASASDPSRLHVIESTVSAALDGPDLGRFDAIYHMAAAVGVRLVIERPIHTIETNIQETSSLLRFALEQGCPTLIALTSEVYGKSTRTPFSEDDDVSYGPTILSRWSYACSKAIDEYLALAHHHEHDLPVVIARFFNTVGPRQVGTYGMVLPRFVMSALAGEPLIVHGDGQQSRCFCDVRDVVPGITSLLSTREAHGRVFNIGSDRLISIHELAQLVIRTLDSASSIEFVAYEEVFKHGFDDLRVRQPDLSRIREAIGFDAGIPLETTIRDLADWLGASGPGSGSSRLGQMQ